MKIAQIAPLAEHLHVTSVAIVRESLRALDFLARKRGALDLFARATSHAFRRWPLVAAPLLVEVSRAETSRLGVGLQDIEPGLR
jgi:hypothetical protein